MKHVMAPVPSIHVPDAVATHDRMGSVLLGSNQFELFKPLEGTVGDVMVWLVASTGYLPKGRLDPPIASATLRKLGGGVIEVAPHMLVPIEPPEGFRP